jgi:hypothetical protein
MGPLLKVFGILFILKLGAGIIGCHAQILVLLMVSSNFYTVSVSV